MRSAVAITLCADEREQLERFARGRSTPARLVQRARVVLAAADGKPNKQIALELSMTPNAVGKWRNRFFEQRLEGIIQDAPGRGRRPKVLQEWAPRILQLTTQQKPKDGTHWSVRSLARHLGCDRNVVHRVWRAANLQPHRLEHFKLSNDPQFTEKVIDVVGLYLNPPEHALVLSVDEKSQIQALDRTQPCLPLARGYCQTRTHDYRRHGTTTLFAALEVAEGKLVAGKCMGRHGVDQWLSFLKLIDAQTPPELDLHLILDNYHTHKNARVVRWLKRHPRFHLHFIPTSSSWLNLVERWFADLSSKRLRRGTFRSVRELENAIVDYIQQHNTSPRPFIWTASAQAILEKVARARRVLDNRSST